MSLDGFKSQIAEAGHTDFADHDPFKGIGGLRERGVRRDEPDDGDQADTSYRRHRATAVGFPMSSV